MTDAVVTTGTFRYVTIDTFVQKYVNTKGETAHRGELLAVVAIKHSLRICCAMKISSAIMRCAIFAGISVIAAVSHTAGRFT